ncbi:MAG: molybdopterin-dependent oxidoreductase [Vulcanimicrobiaceae bacterium]
MLGILSLAALLAASPAPQPAASSAQGVTEPAGGMSSPPASAVLPAAVPIDAAVRARLPRATVSVAFSEMGGQVSGTFAGVRLADLVRAAGAPAGADVRGRANAAYLVVRGSDGYVAIFTLVELDPTDANCAPILADSRNGMPLGSDTGPLRVVAPCDRHPSRSVRNVVSLGIGSALPLPGRRVPL